MEERSDVTGKNAASRIAESQKDALWLTKLHKRLKREKFTGVLKLRFVDGEIRYYSEKDVPVGENEKNA